MKKLRTRKHFDSILEEYRDEIDSVIRKTPYELGLLRDTSKNWTPGGFYEPDIPIEV